MEAKDCKCISPYHLNTFQKYEPIFTPNTDINTYFTSRGIFFKRFEITITCHNILIFLAAKCNHRANKSNFPHSSVAGTALGCNELQMESQSTLPSHSSVHSHLAGVLMWLVISVACAIWKTQLDVNLCPLPQQSTISRHTGWKPFVSLVSTRLA